MPKILAIETSCDETAAAVVNVQKHNVQALGSVISSQIPLHKKTQGVVPEVAARAHIKRIQAVTAEALKQAGTDFSDIDYLASTIGPGLITSLMIGAEFVKGLSLASGKPIIPVNHMLGHLYSAFLDNPDMKLPAMNLIVSGGHTYLVALTAKNKYRVVGKTVDDAVGEAFDKVAKMLNLPYPGGPQVSKCAGRRGAVDYNFPRPMLHSGDYNFSFAGLKTAVLYKINEAKLDIRSESVRANICYSFQNAALDVLITKTIRAAKQYKAKSITLSGGVAANKKLRADLADAAKKNGYDLYVPDFPLCTDNALMIANAAAIQLQTGAYKRPPAFDKLKANPNLEL